MFKRPKYTNSHIHSGGLKKFSFFQLGLCVSTAIMLSLQLFRPIFAEINDNTILKLIYVAGFASAILVLPRVLRSKITDLDIMLFVFILVSVVMSLLSSGTISLDHFMLLGFLCVSYLLGKWAMIDGKSLLILQIVTIIFLIVAFYVVMQLVKYDFDYHYYLHYSGAKLRVGYLTIGLYGVLAVVVLWKSKISSVFRLSLCGLAAIVVFVSGARMSIIILFLLMIFSSLRFFSSKSLRGSMLVGIPLFVVVSGTFIYKYGLERIANIFSYTVLRMTSLLSGGDKSVAGRDDLISLSIDKILESPVLGYGIGSVERIFLGNYPHNMLLEILIEVGIFPGFLLGIIIVLSLKNAWKAYKWGYAYLGFLTLYFVISYLKSFSFYDGRLLFFFIGCLGSLPKVRFRRTNKVIVSESSLK